MVDQLFITHRTITIQSQMPLVHLINLILIGSMVIEEKVSAKPQRDSAKKFIAYYLPVLSFLTVPRMCHSDASNV